MDTFQTETALFKYLVQGVRDYAIFALDPKGNVASWNLGAELAKGYKSHEIIGKHFSVFYSEDAKKIKHPQYELDEALKHGSYEEEGWRIRKDGSRFWASIVITALHDETGQHIGFAKVTRDLSERRQAEEKRLSAELNLEKIERTFALMVSAVKDYAIFVLDPTGHISTWNQGAERIKGWTADEIIGKHFSIFYTEEAKQNKHPEYELEQAIKNGCYEEEGWRVRKDGSKLWASVTITPILGGSAGFVKVTRDLTERRRNEIQLEEAKEQAIMANKLKSQFVANITHEIRTPLSSIIGLGELVAMDNNLDPETHEAAVTIHDSSKHLLGLLNDLLDFAKLEAGKVTVEKIPYSINNVVDDVIGLTKLKANEKHLSLTVNIADQLPRHVSDPNKVRHVLLNLVQNAIKFTSDGGIEIFVERQGDDLYFSVTDTGIGIAKDTQEKLFKPFSQANDSTSRLYGGTGLGLSIAQQYVELMGGKLGLFSKPDRGSTFWFVLPGTFENSTVTNHG